MKNYRRYSPCKVIVKSELVGLSAYKARFAGLLFKISILDDLYTQSSGASNSEMCWERQLQIKLVIPASVRWAAAASTGVLSKQKRWALGVDGIDSSGLYMPSALVTQKASVSISYMWKCENTIHIWTSGFSSVSLITQIGVLFFFFNPEDERAK